MKELNDTGKKVVSSSGRSQYDTEAINLLKDKQFLAWILKECTTEFADYERDEIMKYIETPQVGSVPVEPGLSNTIVVGDAADSKINGEGIVTYDIRFTATLPEVGKRKNKVISIRLFIDVEVQRKERPGYSLISRGIFYTGRMLSEQMGKTVTGKDYDGLQKVYSIWICMNSTLDRANTISRYQINHDFIHGEYKDPENTELIHLIVIRLPKEGLVSKPKNKPTKFLELLSILFSSRMSEDDKLEKIQEYGISVTNDMKERVNAMCNLSEDLLEEGRKEGILEVLASLVKDGVISIQEAAKRANISEDKFRKKITTIS